MIMPDRGFFMEKKLVKSAKKGKKHSKNPFLQG